MPDSISYVNSKDIGPEMTETPWYKGMTTALDRIANYAERARESSPSHFDFSPVAGVFKTMQTHVKCKVMGFVVSSVGPQEISLIIGSRTYQFYVVAGCEPMVLFPIVIDRGLDISMQTVSGDKTFTAFLFYYPE
jgi:hypothetical protein